MKRNGGATFYFLLTTFNFWCITFYLLLPTFYLHQFVVKLKSRNIAAY